MANEFTLADFELIADPPTAATVRTWREASPIMNMLKFKTGNNLTQEGLRFNDLPTVPWRKIGDAFSQLKIQPEPWKERLHFLGAKIDVPYEYVKAGGLVDARAVQSEAVVKGTAFAFNEAFFLNTPSSDEDAIVGIWYRIKTDLGSAQKFDANLDVSSDTAVTSWQHKMMDTVDDLLDRVDGNPNEKVLFMGRTLYFRFQAALRQSQLLDTTTDNLGRNFMTYGKGGPMIVQAGYKVDQSTQILGDAENGITALTGGADSSMYAVRFGEPYLAGFAQELPNAEDVGLTEDRTNYRTVVRGSVGLYHVSPRCMALAYGWTAA